jgi:hypothetical protein
MLQLILDSAAPDYAQWKAGFDARSEAIADAGLDTLQIWRAADAPRVLVLFEVHDRARAEAWLGKERAFGADARATFVETA